MSDAELKGNELEAAFKRLLQDISHERPGALEHLAASAFDATAGQAAGSIVLFGAGYLGRFTAVRLRQVGIEPRAFSDNNSGLWGQSVDGIPVLAPEEAVRRFSPDSAFVVTVYNSSAPRRQLAALGCLRIASFASLCWKYPAAFVPDAGIELPHRMLPQLDEIDRCFQVLADDASRRELYEQVRWRTSLNYEVLSRPMNDADQYFPASLVVPLADEVFVDCGAFDGDSIARFLKCRSGRFGRIYALEPDPGNRKALEVRRAGLGAEVGGRISVLPYAVGSSSEYVQFASTCTAGSRVGAPEANTVVECRALDELLRGVAPTYIKMDIEGAEPDAIAGAAKTLRSKAPVLAACLYHRSEHLWQIPNLIHSLSPGYKIFLRRYAEECWEIVCYAIPESRLVKAECRAPEARR